MSIKALTLMLITILFLIPCPQSSAAKGKDEKLFQEALNLYKNLQTNPTKISNYEIWDTIARAFYSIYRTYPTSPKAPISLFLSGKMYEEMGIRFNSRENLEKSIELNRELVRVFPNATLADDAQIRIARIVEGWDKSQAYLEYEKAVRDFPKGDMIDIAKKKLTELSTYKPTENQTPGSQTETQNNPNGLAYISKIGNWSTNSYTRVVIQVNKERAFESHLLKANRADGTPPRLYVDIKGTTVDLNLQMEPIEKGLLEQIKFARNTLNTVRVALYIKSFKNCRVFPLYDPFRIVMDIYGNDIENDIALNPKESGEEKNLTIPSTIPEGKDISTLRGALGLKVRTVVIDPGHGGHDPGAIGPTGLKEKDVTLAIAKALKSKIEQAGKGFGITRVVLTREDDRFIPLEERTGIAKREHADLFISIHCNAAKDNDARGIETYVLSFTNDPEALAVAARENVTTTKGISDLKDIIKKYLLNSKIDESKRLATHVQSAVTTSIAKEYQSVNDKGIKKAPFIVLIGADVPSILLETSFITNPREEEQLRSERYINEIADGILKGVKLYSTEVETASVAK